MVELDKVSIRSSPPERARVAAPRRSRQEQRGDLPFPKKAKNRISHPLPFGFSFCAQPSFPVLITAIVSVMASSVFYTWIWYKPDGFKQLVAPRDASKVSRGSPFAFFLPPSPSLPPSLCFGTALFRRTSLARSRGCAGLAAIGEQCAYLL